MIQKIKQHTALSGIFSPCEAIPSIEACIQALLDGHGAGDAYNDREAAPRIVIAVKVPGVREPNSRSYDHNDLHCAAQRRPFSIGRNLYGVTRRLWWFLGIFWVWGKWCPIANEQIHAVGATAELGGISGARHVAVRRVSGSTSSELVTTN